jgi:ABC-2 type transport system permease protein
MLARLHEDLRVVAACASAALRVQLQYRVTFLLQLLGNLIGNAVDFFALWALAHRFGTLGGWALPELALLYGVTFIAFGIAGFTANPLEDVQNHVRSGSFDHLLTKPAGLPAQLIGLGFRLPRLGCVLQGLAVYVWGCCELAPRLGAWPHCLLIFAMIGSACLFSALYTVVGALSMWTVEGLEVANCLTYGGSELAKFPVTIYGRWFRRFFTVIVPLACVTYFPVVAALGREDPLGTPRAFQACAPLAGPLALIVAAWFWRAAVLRYRSTGS